MARYVFSLLINIFALSDQEVEHKKIKQKKTRAFVASHKGPYFDSQAA